MYITAHPVFNHLLVHNIVLYCTDTKFKQSKECLSINFHDSEPHANTVNMHVHVIAHTCTWIMTEMFTMNVCVVDQHNVHVLTYCHQQI